MAQAWVRRPGTDDYELGDAPDYTEEPSAEPDSPGPRNPTRRSGVGSGGRRAGSIAAGTGRQTASETSRLLRGKRPTTLAGFILGMVGYAVTINLIHGGPAQVKGWFGAKFLNKPWTGASSSTSTGSGSTSTSPAAGSSVSPAEALSAAAAGAATSPSVIAPSAA